MTKVARTKSKRTFRHSCYYEGYIFSSSTSWSPLSEVNTGGVEVTQTNVLNGGDEIACVIEKKSGS